jgi:hypothetical protein
LIVGLVLRRAGSERLLQQRLRFEILVSELSASINMVGPAERSALVTRWLKRLGACLEVDRVSLLPAANGHHGVMPLALGAPWGTASAYPSSDFPALTSLVARGVVVRFASLEALPAELASDRPAFRRNGVEAAVLVPLRHNGAVRALAWGPAQTVWPVTLVERLEFVGAILGRCDRPSQGWPHARVTALEEPNPPSHSIRVTRTTHRLPACTRWASSPCRWRTN